MSTAQNINVVHESEAQRQHARVKLPAVLRYTAASRERVEARILDISAGGFSFSTGKVPVTVGEHHKGRLQFQLDSLDLGIDVEFQVQSVDNTQARIGCQFHNLKPREQATLRYLISAYLGGELVSVGDLLNTLQRENFTKARKQGGAGNGMNALGRLRAVTFSLAVFLVGLAAFGFIFKSVYGLYFVTHAKSAQVSVPSLQVTMPREGTVQSLIRPDQQVEKGAPIASFSASMLEMLKGHLDDEQLDPANIETLFGKQVKGTLTSPCNCKVSRQLVADGQFASKGDVIFELVPQDTQANILASFPYSKLEQARPGTRATFQVAGDEQERQGTIVSSTLHDNGLSSDIRVIIKPDQALPSSLASLPAEVTLDGGPSFNWLINKAVASGL